MQVLTNNGIKPQVIDAIDIVQMEMLAQITDFVVRNRSLRGLLMPAVDAVRQGFINFNAVVDEPQYRIHAHQLQAGELTINQTHLWHADKPDHYNDLATKDEFIARLLVCSSAPAKFLDMTNNPDAPVILDGMRIANHDALDQGDIFYREELLDHVQPEQILQFKPGDIILCDGGTLHKAQPALYTHRRVLLNSEMRVRLPLDWRHRTVRGHQPKFLIPAIA